MTRIVPNCLGTASVTAAVAAVRGGALDADVQVIGVRVDAAAAGGA